jgi:hypothetical protein
MRTVIGGAQIIDMVRFSAGTERLVLRSTKPLQMILVIDVTKGIQAQTAEVRVMTA